MIRFLLPLTLALLPVAAQALEPKKPSQLVTLVPSGTCQSDDGFLYGNRVNPDGSFSSFTIPPKQVLVVTRWAFTFTGGAGTAGTVAALATSDATSALARVYFPFDADGSGGGATELSAVVGEGEVLCGFHVSGLQTIAPFDGFIEGFLTKAK